MLPHSLKGWEPIKHLTPRVRFVNLKGMNPQTITPPVGRTFLSAVGLTVSGLIDPVGQASCLPLSSEEQRPPYRSNELPPAYPWAGCTPAEPASVSAGDSKIINVSYRTKSADTTLISAKCCPVDRGNLRGFYDTPGEALSLAADDHRLFVGDQTYIQVLDYSEVYNQVVGQPVPTVLLLSDPYPNPFNSTASVRLTLPYSKQVNLNVVDITGRVIVTKDYGRYGAGNHTFTIDARSLVSGLYYLQVNIGTVSAIKPIVVMK